MSITLSRIYKIDDVETNIAATDDDPQAALRLLERAADILGTAPDALPIAASAPTKNKGGRPKKAAEPAPPTEAIPPLPAGVATAFEPQLPLAPSIDSIIAPPSGVSVTLTEDPPAPLGRSTVSLAPPSGPPAFAPPPVFAPPPAAPVDPMTALRDEAFGIQKDMIATIQAKAPGWLDQVSQTINSIVATFGGNVQTMTKDQLEGAITQFRNYAGVLAQHLGA